MTDKEFAQQKKRIDQLAKKWLKPLGLLWWDIDLVFEREGIDSGEVGWETHAVARVKWQYTRAEIRFNMPAVLDMTDEALETTFLHECAHIFLNECREEEGYDKHEERVATVLADAFRWVREAGQEEGK